MILVFLLLLIIALEIFNNYGKSKELNRCYKLLLEQHHKIIELETKIKVA